MFQRKEIIGDCTLYLGDSTVILPTIGNFDCCICDPPYEFEASGAGIFRTNRKCMDAIQATGLDQGFDHTILTPAQFSSVICFCHNDQLAELLPYFADQFGRYALCFWHKDNPMPVANKHYKPDTEIYIHAWNAEGFPVGDLRDKGRYVFAPVGKSEYDHPTVKPDKVMDKILRNINGHTVCDPFMGTGSTAVSCIKHQRQFTGIEINPDYFDIALERIEAAYRQQDLFTPSPARALQDSLI